MRHLFVLFTLIPLCLFAQKTEREVFGKGWFLSLSVQAERNSEFSISPFVTESDTVDIVNNVGNRRFSRLPDTIRLNGNETIYYREPSLQYAARRKQAIFSLLSSIRLHYRTNDRLEVSLGFFYEPTYRDEARIDDISTLPNDFYYLATDVDKTFGGLIGDFTYHLRKGKLLRPYVGLQTRLGLRHQKVIRSTKFFPGLNEEIDVTNNIRERFRTNNILDLDLTLLAGVNYQVSHRFAIGIEAKLGQYLIPIPRALQIRYRLRKDREEGSYSGRDHQR